MIEAELFDGTVLEFPDGTAPEVVQRKVKELTAARRGGAAAPVAAPPAKTPVPNSVGVPLKDPPPQESSLIDTIMGGADYALNSAAIGLAGARKGVSGVVGLPVDLVNAAPTVLNLLPGVDGVGPIAKQPFMGSDFIDAILGAPTDLGAAALNEVRGAAGSDQRVPGREGPAPVDMFQRGVGRVGQELGAAGVPVGGALAAAARLGIDGARKLPSAARMLVEPAAVNPGKFVGKETAVATGAGMGAAGANEAVPDSPIADLLGAIFGAGVTGIGGRLARGGRDLLAAGTGSPKFASQVVQENVADEMIRSSEVMGRQVDPADMTKPLDTTALIDAINRPSQAEAAIPGFQASTADRAGDAGLAGLENARAKANLGPYKTRSDANVDAVDQSLNRLAPTETPGAFRSALDDRRNSVMADAANTATTAEQRFRDAAARLETTMSGEGRGSVIRDALEEAKAAAREIERDAYPDLSRVEADIVPLADELNGYMNRLSTAERQVFVPAQVGIPDEIVRTAMDGVENAEGLAVPTSMREAVGLRRVLNDRLREATSKQAADEARVLRGALDVIDGYMDNALPADLRAQDMRARETSRALNDTFTRPNTPIARILKRSETRGTYATTDDTVAPRFVRSDEKNASSLRDVRSTVGGFEATNPRLGEVDSALKDQIRADIRRLRDNPAQLDRYMAENQQVLDTYPDLRDEIAGTATAGRGAQTAAESRAAIEKDMTSGTVGRYWQYSDANAEKAMREVMSAKDPGKTADELLTFVNDDPVAVQGARAAFWRNMDEASRSKNAVTETSGGKMPLVGRKLLAFLDDPAKAAVAERLYRDNPEHLQSLREIGEALRGVNLGSRVGAATNPSGTAAMMRGQAAVSMAEVGSKLYQAKIGRISPTFVVAHLAGKLARVSIGSQRAKAFELLLDKALLDPETATMLLKENNPANRAAMARWAKGWRANEAATIVDMLTGEDDEVKDKVMEPDTARQKATERGEYRRLQRGRPAEAGAGYDPDLKRMEDAALQDLVDTGRANAAEREELRRRHQTYRRTQQGRPGDR